MSSVEQGEPVVSLTVEITADQRRWLEETSKRSGESPDALMRQALQILRRASAYRVPAGRGRARVQR